MSALPALTLDVELLSRGSPHDVASYIREQYRIHPEPVVTKCLLHLTKAEAVPSDISPIWLRIVKDPTALYHALEQKHSTRLRCCAIRRFGLWLRKPHWRSAWAALGAAQGIAQLLATFSVHQVSMFTHAVSANVRGIESPDKIAKRGAVTELLLLLVPELSFIDSGITPRSPGRSIIEQRDLVHHYSALLPACTPEMVYRVLFGQQDVLTLRGNQGHLLREHSQVFLEAMSLPEPPASKWNDQGKHLPSLTLAVILSSIKSQEPSRIDRFASRMFNLILSQPQSTQEAMVMGRAQRRARDPAAFEDRMRNAAPQPHSRVDSIIAFFRQLIEHRSLRSSDRKRIMEITVDVVMGHSSHIDAVRMGLWKQAARSWSQSPEDYHPILERLFRLKRLPGRSYTFSCLQYSVPRQQRWQLLKLIYSSSTDNSTDLDNNDQLRSLVSSDPEAKSWPVSVFLALDKTHALCLLERLSSSLPRNRFVSNGGPDSILGYSMAGGYLNFEMVRLEIDPTVDIEDRVRVASLAVEDFKSKALKSSDPGDRQHLASCTLIWATCSRSFDLYIRTVVWLRRYVRDVVVARSIFSEANLHKREAIQLLSGIPLELNKNVTAEQVREHITLANNAIWEWFETLCTSALEPSFIVSDAAGARSLARPVVIERMRRINELQDHLGLNTEAISTLVWDETIRLLIRIEETCMHPDFRRLHLYNLAGPLSKEFDEQLLTSEGVIVRSVTALAFVEKYYQARDALWTQHRLSLDPAIVKLPAGLPRGIPLHLAPGIWNLDHILPRVPSCLIVEKARGIVFADPQVVLQPMPTDEEVISSMRECHEDYEFALLLLIKTQTGKKQKFEVMLKAWEYATTFLSPGATNLAEAEVFWRNHVFNRMFLDDRFPDPRYLPGGCPEFQLPTGPYQSHEPIEWTPQAPFPRNRRPEPNADLEHIVLDTMIRQDVILNVHDGSLCYHTGRFDECGGWNPLYSIYCAALYAGHNGEGPHGNLKRFERSTIEAKIVKDLLLIETSCTSENKILSLPFPDQDTVRYPNVVLNASFPERASFDVDEQVQYKLPKLSNAIPPTLLRRLSESFIAARKDQRLAKTSRVPINLLRCLTMSDRPSESTNLVVEMILGSPDVSSWHRSLFSRRYLRMLPAEDARTAMQSLASRILERTGGPNNGRGIKISTVKLLAQSLGGDHFPTADAVDILMQMLSRSDHVDVRHAVITSMLAIMCNRTSTTDAAAERVIAKVEALIPILAALDETRPEEAPEKWKGEDLPSIYDGSTFASQDLQSMRKLPRTFELVVDALRTHKLWAPVLMDRILLPAIRKSIEHHRQWLDRFLKPYSATVESLNLPVPPTKLEMLSRLVTQHPALTPDWVVQLYCKVLRFTLRPPHQVTEINAQLEGSEGNAERHWLSNFEAPKERRLSELPFLAYFVYGVAEEASNLADVKARLSSRSNAITEVRSVLLSTLEVILDAGLIFQFVRVVHRLGYRGEIWKAHRNGTCKPLGEKRRKAWEYAIRPALQTIIEKVESVRTPSWQRDPQRYPPVLPNTFELRLWLLPYPADNEASVLNTFEHRVEQCRRFAEAIAAEISRLIATRLPWNREMEELKNLDQICTPSIQLLTAASLGSLKFDDSLELHCHCIDIAAKLISVIDLHETQHNDELDRALQNAQQTVLEWSQSDIEWIRNKAQDLLHPHGPDCIHDFKVRNAIQKLFPQRDQRQHRY